MLRLAIDEALVAVLLFAGAGTIAWTRAWILLAVMATVRVASAIAVYRVHPSLLSERARLPLHATQAWTDRVLLLGGLATGFLGLPLIAGLDVFHWHVGVPPTHSVTALGLVLFACGWTLKGLALRANAFAVSVVRLQPERSHAVAETGPYALVRHPFYAADIGIHVGVGFWLGSYLVAVLAVIPLALVMFRLRHEERFLQAALPGYTAYAARVPHRLIPHVW